MHQENIYSQLYSNFIVIYNTIEGCTSLPEKLENCTDVLVDFQPRYYGRQVNYRTNGKGYPVTLSHNVLL